MNWEAIGAVGDLVGGLAVVLSLVYVASQIRQSSRQLELSSRNIEASMYHQTGDAFSRWWALLAQDEALIDLWHRALAGDDLSRNEQTRFHFLISILFIALENNHQQVQLGAVRRDSLEISRANLAQILGSPGGARWWEKRALFTLSPEFREAVDRRLGAA